MTIYRALTPSPSETAVALGLFDGLHRGHRAVIARAAEEKKNGLLPAVFTFTLSQSQPKKKKGLKRILTESLFLERLSALGAEAVEMPPFEAIRELTPRAFVEEVLVRVLRARVAVCGENFHFGKNASGDAALLRSLCAEFGIEAVVLPPVLDGGEPVSSTRIRACLERGEIAEANRLLGEPYAFDFTVVHGNELGRTIGIPTINQLFDERLQLPRFGVYASYAFPEGEHRRAITNVGIKPTIEGERLPLAETYIIGADEDLYGRRVKVELVEFLRPERRFASFDELAAQMHADVERAKAVLDK